MTIISGNLDDFAEKNSHRRGWFIGHFMENEFKTDNFALKWATHKKGPIRGKCSANQDSKSISILIKGKMKICFPKDNKEHIIAKPGDYIYWDKGVFHTTTALEDCLILTIRWPSKDDLVVE